MKLITILSLLLLLSTMAAAQTFTYPSYLSLQGNDSIHQERLTIQVTDKDVILQLGDNYPETYRIGKKDSTSHSQEVTYRLSCGAKLELSYKGEFISAIFFKTKQIHLYTGPAFCRAVIEKKYQF
jgi:ubiquitin